MRKVILVTGVGGNVAQGVIRNILSCKYDVKIVGTNTESVSGGNHLCDVVYKVPFSTQPAYIPAIKKICEKEKVDLIIPTTDYETYHLALAGNKLPKIACSNAKIAFIFLNKYKTWQEFRKYSIPFAETRLPSQYKNEFKEIVVKPVEGRGSRDVYIKPTDVTKFKDDFIIQKYYKGKEITTAFYVTKERQLLGQITFERVLYSGYTSQCQVSFAYDRKIERIIKMIIHRFDIKGSCNIQAIIDEKGMIVPFEINARISGTNSIRGQFGFEDVKYTIQEYLLNETPKKPVIKKGAAVRFLADVIYPDIDLKDIKNKFTKYYIY